MLRSCGPNRRRRNSSLYRWRRSVSIPIVVAACCSPDLASAAGTAAASLSTMGLTGDVSAVQLLQDDKGLAQSCEAEDAAWLIRKGWWAATRELVLASHEAVERDHGRERQQALHNVVRREVGTLKKHADDLLLALSPQDASKIGVVKCAVQWSQNSTAIFLSVKFAHRWSSPGALQVHNVNATASPCCFFFSAEGEHSQLRKRYNVDFNFLHKIDPETWNYRFAAAGRMTVEIRKKEQGFWERLLKAKEKPGNLQKWDAMDQQWKTELKPYKEQYLSDQYDADEAKENQKQRELESHAEMRKKCRVGKYSPWRTDRYVNYLCDKYWPPKMEGLYGKSATWIVLFASAREMDCKTRTEQCSSVKKQWSTVAEKLPGMVKVQVAAVDCDDYKALCDEQKVGHLPYVRRYRKGKRKTYRGEWDIPALSAFATED